MADSQPPEAISNSPFDKSAVLKGADLIIRSSDDTNFYVHKGFLGYQSLESFFSGLFTCSPSSGTELHDGLPVVTLEEPASTLHPLLKICYPEEVIWTSSNDFALVADAAGKYGLDRALDRLHHIAIRENLVKEQPALMYCVAVKHRWRELSILAARSCLSLPLDTILASSRLTDISSRQLVYLMTYYQKCRHAVTTNAQDALKRGGITSKISNVYCRYRDNGPFGPGVAYGAILSSLQDVPDPAASHSTWETKIKSFMHDGTSCSCILFKDPLDFSDCVKHLEELISKEELPLDF